MREVHDAKGCHGHRCPCDKDGALGRVMTEEESIADEARITAADEAERAKERAELLGTPPSEAELVELEKDLDLVGWEREAIEMRRLITEVRRLRAKPETTFTVMSRPAQDTNPHPSPWSSKLRTTDLEAAVAEARRLDAQGWTDVAVAVDWRV